MSLNMAFIITSIVWYSMQLAYGIYNITMFQRMGIHDDSIQILKLGLIPPIIIVLFGLVETIGNFHILLSVYAFFVVIWASLQLYSFQVVLNQKENNMDNEITNIFTINQVKSAMFFNMGIFLWAIYTSVTTIF